MEEIKSLPEGAAWRWGEPGDEAYRQGGIGWYHKVTLPEKGGGVERKTNLTLPSYVRGGEALGQLAKAAGGGDTRRIPLPLRDV